LICEYSEFFKAACNEHWESGKTNTVILAEDDPIIFSIFLTWLVSGDVNRSADLLPFLNPCQEKATKIFSRKHLMQLVKCYVLGDALQAEQFCNSIMDAIVSRCEQFKKSHNSIPCSTAPVINYIIENTKSKSPLLELLLDTWTSKKNLKKAYDV